MSLFLTWTASGERALAIMLQALRDLGPGKFASMASRVTNRVGDMARTQVRRTLPDQAGLRRQVIVRAVRTTRATVADATYVLTASGGQIALKHFGARETRSGVSAAPRGQRQVFAGTFLKGGRFPNRKDIGMGGHVFERLGDGRLPIGKVKSDVTIPQEMVTGATAAAFTGTAGSVFPRRLRHEVEQATGRVFS